MCFMTLANSNKTVLVTKSFAVSIFYYVESIAVSNLLEYLVGCMLEDNVTCHMMLPSSIGKKMWFHAVEISVLTKTNVV